MANTYTQLYIHFVIVVKYRQHLIHPSFEAELYKYITGIIQNNKHKLIAINGMPDHIHIFIGLHPAQSLSDLMRDVKTNSTVFVKRKNFTNGNFAWQEGFGAFSYSQSHISQVCKYIENQKEHHKHKTFKEEYLHLLKIFQIAYKEEFLFDFFD
jgi:REP element-mobilizing transposase RayT